MVKRRVRRIRRGRRTEVFSLLSLPVLGLALEFEDGGDGREDDMADFAGLVEEVRSMLGSEKWVLEFQLGIFTSQLMELCSMTNRLGLFMLPSLAWESHAEEAVI